MLAPSASASVQQMQHLKKGVTDPPILTLPHNHDATRILNSTSSLQVGADDAGIEGVVVAVVPEALVVPASPVVPLQRRQLQLGRRCRYPLPPHGQERNDLRRRNHLAVHHRLDFR